MEFISSTARRVPGHTSASVNDYIRQETDRQVNLAAQAGPEGIERRLAQTSKPAPPP